MKKSISIKGARVHNLKNLSLEIPHFKFTVVTGLSGSGKSSLAIDTVYAEGQRRYVESLSAYARQFLGQMQKPDVDRIDGLFPAIAIDQKSGGKNPRSTVGTVTEISDSLRLLFARVGTIHCPRPACGNLEIKARSSQEIIDSIIKDYRGKKINILYPAVSGKKGSHEKVFEEARRNGFIRVIVDNEPRLLDDDNVLEKNIRHDIDIVVDRLQVNNTDRSRLADSIETALRFSGGLVKIRTQGNEDEIFSENLACTKCGYSFTEITPRLFSFNSPYGACLACDGLGVVIKKHNPMTAFSPRKIAMRSSKFQRNYNEIDWSKVDLEDEGSVCPSCKGARLRPEALAIKLNGKNINEIVSMPIKDAKIFIDSLKFSQNKMKIAKRIFKELSLRLGFLNKVGLDYISLARSQRTLSGGEAQRIRLATQIGSGLVGVLYVLDEPSIGLHQRDNHRLLKVLRELCDYGNTLLVIEHDEETIRNADHIIDMGPGAGIHGGQIVVAGNIDRIIKDKSSLTGKYLSGRLKDRLATKNRKFEKHITVIGARQNNLKNINVSVPQGVFTCITGVSGAGKSSLVYDILYKSLQKKLYKSRVVCGDHDRIEGLDDIDKAIMIDQSPIGRTPRSNPVTYTGIFSPIRDLYSQLPESRLRGYKPGRFSFNVKGGRCENCRGAGETKIEMYFLADIYLRCDVCKGKRFDLDTLEVKYRGKNISDILNLAVEEAVGFFIKIPQIHSKLLALNDVGLGYIKLGQSALTLSGGEAQRVKLSRELAKRSTGKTVYILDEPTTGLHFEDVQMLLTVLHRLADEGNTIIVIEHNLDVISSSDYIVDLGPEGGNAGGYIVAEGRPGEIMKNRKSSTGLYLKKHL